jgi:fructose transport system ATP-binding protein
MADLQIRIGSVSQPVETLSGGQRQGVAVARSAAVARPVFIMVEPPAARGVEESRMVLGLIRRVRDRGLPVVLISHDMPQVFELADRIHVARLGRRVAVLNPRAISMSDTVAVMTGALRPEELAAEALA